MTPTAPEAVRAPQASRCPAGHPVYLAPMTSEGVIRLARRRNVALTQVGDRHCFRGPEAAVAELTPLLREHKQALLALLGNGGSGLTSAAFTGAEPWDQSEALSLTEEADALVEWLGVDCLHPAIVDAAAMIGSAFAARDLETVRFACSEFAATVRELAHPGRLTPRHR